MIFFLKNKRSIGKKERIQDKFKRKEQTQKTQTKKSKQQDKPHNS